jgi:hypothetical protein
VNGSVGLVLAPGGRLSRVLSITIAGGRIARIDIIADPARLRARSGCAGRAEAGLSPVENLSKRRADRVENLCAKINFCADQASFVRERRRALSFVLRFACPPTVNA